MTASNWTLPASFEQTNDGGTAIHHNASASEIAVYKLNPPTINKVYKVTFTYNATVAGGITVAYGGRSTAVGAIDPAVGTPVTYNIYYRPSGVTNLQITASLSGRFTITDISITLIDDTTGDLTATDINLTGILKNPFGTTGLYMAPNGIAYFPSAVVIAGGFSGVTTMSMSGSLTQTISSLTTTPTDGFHTSGSSANASIQTRVSPSIRQTSYAWNGSASKTNSIESYLLPVAGATTYAKLITAARYIDGVASGAILTTLLSNGNFGIGTTTPSAKMQVVGGVVLGPTTDSDSDSLFSLNGLEPRLNYGATLKLSDTSPVAVGIGSRILLGSVYNSTGSTTGGVAIGAYKESAVDGTYGYALTLSTRANGGSVTERMRILGDGSVGIGTGAPQSTFVVQKNASGARGGELSIVNGIKAVGSEAALNFGVDASTYNADNGNAQIKAVNMDANAATDMVFSTWNGTAWGERARIQANGNVGIGVTGPTATLHLKAGTATAGTAPLKFVPVGAVANTTPEVGAFEPVGDTLLYTIPTGTERKTIAFTSYVDSNLDKVMGVNGVSAGAYKNFDLPFSSASPALWAVGTSFANLHWNEAITTTSAGYLVTAKPITYGMRWFSGIEFGCEFTLLNLPSTVHAVVGRYGFVTTSAELTLINDNTESIACFAYSFNGGTNELWAESCNAGDTLERTSINWVSTSIEHSYRIERTSTSVKFYFDGELAATHTSGLPGGTGYINFGYGGTLGADSGLGMQNISKPYFYIAKN